MTRRFVALAAAVAAVVLLGVSGASFACVGKTLVIGSVNAPNVTIVSELMSILITERTGTTVVVKYFDNFDACYDSMEKGEVDILVDFTGRCYTDVLNRPAEADAARVFSEVKEVFQREKNLVWLEPFGFSDADTIKSENASATPAMAAPVVRKDTLNKFPALPRVINKLAGKLDNTTVEKLVDDSGGAGDDKKAKRVTRKFLKDKRLI